MTAEEEDPLGLPLQEELMPLSQSLITPTLSFIFRINFDPKLALDDASEAGSLGRLSDLGSLESGDADFPRLRGGGLLRSSPASGFRLKGDTEDGRKRKSGGKEEGEEEEEEVVEELDSESESELGRGRWVENNATANNNNSSNEEGAMARTLKRPRLVWTPQLHKRFVDAVHHLGIKNAVPKTIMQLMNVDGLTRENVASHLQKYRLYLKRIRLPLSHSKNPLAPIPAPAFLAPPLSPFQFAPAPSTQHFGGFPLPSSSSSLLPSNTLFLSQQECVKKDDENSPQPQLLTFFPTKGC